MLLQQLTSRIFYYPHQPETDRPMLVYLKGDKLTLAIDAGSSANHVDEFYNVLTNNSLILPNFTVITHWHWDHTFGMHKIHGLSIAHRKTNKFLENERKQMKNADYLQSIKIDNKCFEKEYSNNTPIKIVTSDIEYEDNVSLFLGSLTVHIFHAVSPHSEDTTLIYLPEDKVLFLGDSTSEDFFNDGFMDLDKLKSLTDLIENMDCKYCILSHTEPLRKPDLLDYLKSILYK